MSTACYVRVSTEEQSLDRQLESTHDRAEELGTDPSEIVTYRDKATGTDTDRSDYRELMDAVDGGEHDRVIVHSVSRLSRSIRDFDRAVERIVEDNDTALHIISEGFDLVPGDDDPYQRAMLQILATFAELEAKMAQRRTEEGIQTRMAEEGYHHGPPPLGFEKDDGYLIESSNFDQVRATLALVRDEELSKRKAARELDTSRRTINRSLDRLDLYGLKPENTV